MQNQCFAHSFAFMYLLNYFNLNQPNQYLLITGEGVVGVVAEGHSHTGGVGSVGLISQQSASAGAPGKNLRQLFTPQVSPGLQSLQLSQSPSPNPHLLEALQQPQEGSPFHTLHFSEQQKKNHYLIIKHVTCCSEG